jgi:hypothetical protein
MLNFRRVQPFGEFAEDFSNIAVVKGIPLVQNPPVSVHQNNSGGNRADIDSQDRIFYGHVQYLVSLGRLKDCR